MELTQKQLEGAGYSLKAAPDDAWRDYDEHNPNEQITVEILNHISRNIEHVYNTPAMDKLR